MQEKKYKIPKRIILNTGNELHEEIKKRATFRGQTISDWVKMAIRERIHKEKLHE
jgi:predicted HicB family RNase H-like nuclease